MPFIEAPTTFYMGRRFDPTTRRLVDEVVYYDSRDLTTHAVVVGMTGSGKTGLCITLLEEAVMDDIPSIVIDPKGDITNLLLAFPDLKPENLQPWINVDDARRAGLELSEYAVDVAQRWRDGLASWGITPQRVRTFKENARFSIYTPGSDAGLPISILDAMQAPRNGWQPGEDEFHRERINGIVTALLALIGKDVEPVKDREHVLIANIFETAWRKGQDLTLEDIIVQVQKPPFAKLGVFDVDTFFPEKGRFQLAMELNNILASPSFQSWIQGEPLDIQSLLYTPEGKPRVSIFYIAHLTEAERMFIVTLLLENMQAWMRTLSGTTSLRAILYFDEVFGYFPPHPYNPPSKRPMLQLLKQARAFGVGLVLATQNPGDIDYKGLANAGTWFIGKLQTENDKNKVLSGLESVATVDNELDLQNVDRVLSSIDPRVFVMHNVHDRSGPIPIHTRWAMSFLRGPLTRQQIRTLMADQRQQPYYPSYGEQHHTGTYATPPGATQMDGSAPYGVSPDMAPLRDQGGATAEVGVQDPSAPPTLPEVPGAPARGSTPPPLPPGTIPPQADPDITRQTPDYATPTGGWTQGGNVSRSQPQVALPEDYSLTRPPLPSSMAQYFLPTEIPLEQALALWSQRTGMRAQMPSAPLIAYAPFLLAQAEVRYADRKSGVSAIRAYPYHVPQIERAGLVRWDEHLAPYIEPGNLLQEPESTAAFGDLSPGLTDAKRMRALKTELTDYIYKTAGLTILHNPELDLYGQPGMPRRDFLVQAQGIARQRRDEEFDKITSSYAKQIERLDERLRRELRELSADQQQLQDLRHEEFFTGAEAALSLLRGRTAYTLSRVSRTRRYKGQAKEDVYESEQVIAELEADIERTRAKLEGELHRSNQKWLQISRMAEEYRITPYKKDVYLGVFGIGWKPHWLIYTGGAPALAPAWGEA